LGFVSYDAQYIRPQKSYLQVGGCFEDNYRNDSVKQIGTKAEHWFAKTQKQLQDIRSTKRGQS